MLVPRVFDETVFGAKLARIVDTLYAFYIRYHRINYEHLPNRGLFTVATGASFFEADVITRHYYLDPSELKYCLKETQLQDAHEALGWSDDTCPGAFMTGVRQMLQASYAKGE